MTCNVAFNGLFVCKRTDKSDQEKFVELAKGEKREYAYKGDTRVHNVCNQINIGTSNDGHDSFFLKALFKAGFKEGKDFTYEPNNTLPVNNGPEMKPKNMVQILDMDDVRKFNRFA